jgi:proline iminopeptidase
VIGAAARSVALRVVALALLCFAAAPASAAPLYEGGARRLGTKLTYAVQSGATSYGFVATVLRASPDVQYEWYTTSPVAADGVREIAAATLATAATHCECYENGEWGARGSATALWLSRAAFAALSGGGNVALAFNDRPGREAQPRTLAVERRAPFALRVDGAETTLPAIVVRADSGTVLWVHDNGDDPLVLAIEGGWQMRLTGVWQRRDDELGRFVAVDGLGVHIVERGSGPPMLVLHGGPGMEGNYFRPYLEPLERDVRLVYVDQPGQGLSQRLPPGTRYAISGAVAAVERLRESLGFERMVLLGHSYGGFIAQLYALAYLNRLAGLVLVDTAPSYEYNVEANRNIQRFGTPEQRRVTPGLSNDERIRRVFALYFDPPDPVAADAFMDRVILSAEAWRQLIATQEFRTFDTRPRLGEIRVPTLVVVGENDLITTARQARILAGGIPGARLHVFPGTGHNPFVEEPDAFNELVRGFVRALALQ